MCAQSMLLDSKKIHSLCAFNNYKYEKSRKTQFILLFLATSFGLEGHKEFEHKINRFYIYIRFVLNLSFDPSQFVLLCGYKGLVW